MIKLKKSVITLVLLVGVFTVSTPLMAGTEKSEVRPQSVPSLLVKANKAYAAKDYLALRKTLEQLHALRPNNGEYMYQLVIAHALLDEKTPAYDLMLHMQQQGLSYDFNKTEATRNIRDTEVYDYVNDLMVMAGNPVGESENVFELPARVAIPETMVWDESRQKFLIGTVSDGSIFAVDEAGQITELLKANSQNGMWAVLDILIDQPRNRLWVSSAAIPAFSGFDPADKGRSALFEFDLDSLQLVRRYPVPVDGRPHVLGSMVLSPNGDIFIVDRVLPLVYTKPANEQNLKVLLASGDMASMRGVAMQPDGNVMYVADREMGILVIDVKGHRAMKLITPETLNLGGIDGLYLWNNRLVVIQNGNKPQRLMRLQLDASGTKVEAVRPLAVAQTAFDNPSYGTIKGEDIYYFANSQTTMNDKQKTITVLRTPLDSNKDLVSPDMKAYLDERGKKMEAKNAIARKKLAEKEKSEKEN